MAALQCEICGGKLVGRPGGLFECEYCGVQYDTAWAKEKIQEIKGTVKIEGTVEVQGTVSVAGGVNLDSLLKRGFTELADGNTTAAKDAFDRALDIDASFGDIYVGLLMCRNHIRDRESYYRDLLNHAFDEAYSLKKILTLSGSDQFNREVLDYKAKVEREAALRAENVIRGQKRAPELKALREKYAPVLQRISEQGCAILDSNGTLYFAQNNRWNGINKREYSEWKNLMSISDCGWLMAILEDGHVETVVDFDRNTIERIEAFSPDDDVWQVTMIQEYGDCRFAGLKGDGSIVTSGYSRYDSDVSKLASKIAWKDIVQIGTHDGKIIGLSKDGTVYGLDKQVSGIASINEGWFLKTDGTVASIETNNPGYNNRIADWADLIQISGGKDGTAGLRADGTVVYTDIKNDESTRSRQHEIANWRDIVAVRAYYSSILGVKSDGSLVTAGPEFTPFLKDHPNFRVFENLETINEENAQRKNKAYFAWEEAEIERLREESRIKALRAPLESELEQIHRELANLKGLFKMKRRNELETRMGEILLKLDELQIDEDR